MLCPSLEDALKSIECNSNIETCWVIGGSSIYKEAMELPNCHRIYLTKIDQEFECDVFFPQIDNKKFVEIADNLKQIGSEIQTEGDITYRYKVFENQIL